MKSKKLKIVFWSFSICVLSFLAFLAGIYIQVSEDASSRIERGVIEKIIFSESPVYYDDGETPIGVYFDKTHSRYIHYKNIPKVYIKAIIASEDGNFFNHPGFDMKAIIRAFIANLKAGRVVQGGSTLTQQTAKNIFKRQKKTYTAKLKELIQALLLERRYSKEEILEMYVNQFFVTGFGKGLGIASEYFFDKKAEDLDLVESAFLAGMVKGPYLYNPFTKKTEVDNRETIRLAKMRKDYVLKNMRILNFITEEQYLEAREKAVPFKEGKVTYGLNVIMDYVREQLESEYFRTILHEQGVDNIATSGIKIYTSIDKEIQQGALRSLRRNLSFLDVKLSGYNADLFQDRYVTHAGSTYSEPKDNLPFLCRITYINQDSQNPALIVAWKNGGGVIDYEGLKTMGEAWLRWKLGEWAVFDRRHILDFLKIFNIGDIVPIQYTEDRNGKSQRRLVLTEIPDLEGGVVVLRNGMVKAMIGGFFDRYFNRAADAKRQLGSIFKPLVYTAALQLKWNSLDPLTNMRDLFKFENTFYLPKPDHKPKSDMVSMMWAGAKSENLATVWLLYHLTDRLNMSEFRQLVESLGLGRKKTESYQDYAKRIRDRHGVVVHREALMEGAFEESKKEIESDLIFSGFEDALGNLRRLHFNIDEHKLNLNKGSDIQIARLNFRRLRTLNLRMKKKFKKIQHLSELYSENSHPGLGSSPLGELRHFYLKNLGENVRRVIYSEAGQYMSTDDIAPLTPELVLGRQEKFTMGHIWIDNLIPSEIIDLLQETLGKNHKELLTHKRYDLDVLSRIRDFRTLVNLYYVKELAKAMGVTTRIDPVLSFPLGANSISILEAALSYYTIISGHSYPLNSKIVSGMTPIITKIVDREGETIWEYRPRPQKVLSGRISGQVVEILRMVIEEGTGRKAKDAVQLSLEFENGKVNIPIPAFGKTGTANRYSNSSFVGFIPKIDKHTGKSDLKQGYIIASYVGYDDNSPMKGKNVTIYGASGALPIWIDVVDAIANSKEFKGGIEVADLAFDQQSAPLLNDRELRPLNISPLTGLPLPTKNGDMDGKSPQVYSHVEITGDTFILKRFFEPLKGAFHEENISH